MTGQFSAGIVVSFQRENTTESVLALPRVPVVPCPGIAESVLALPRVPVVPCPGITESGLCPGMRSGRTMSGVPSLDG